MRRSLSSLVGMGLMGCIFLAVMSLVYLDRFKGKEDVARLEEELRMEHGLYLSALAPLTASLVEPSEKSKPRGLLIDCVLRANLTANEVVLRFHLDRIAQSVFTHPDWKGYLGYVTVSHKGPTPLTCTFQASASAKAP
ncbi:MAG: hypothetical protein ACT4PV_12005 [Planctomycetaceae bacterium]